MPDLLVIPESVMMDAPANTMNKGIENSPFLC
jgi:hypothetical protein